MNTNLSVSVKKRLRQIVYLAGFFLTLNTSITAYINSSFLETFVDPKIVGLFYVISSILSIAGAFAVNKLVHQIGSKRTLTILSLSIISILILTLSLFAYPIALLLIMLYLIFNYLLTVNLDLYLEQNSDDDTTGGVRGIFLTLVNLAWLFSPLIAGRLIDLYGFRAVYVFAVLALIPFFFLISRLKKVEVEPYTGNTIIQTLKHIWSGQLEKTKNLRAILAIDFILNFFFATMVIYSPIYLHQVLGFDWTTIGMIFTVMLAPYVVLQLGLGHTADKLMGEKEILIAGLSIAGLSTTALSFISTPSPIIWAIVLLFTRIGAASIEIMKESYLFKQIDDGDINTIFISRNNWPLAYIIAPLIFSPFLFFFSFRFLFLVLGLIVLLALIVASRLKDTK